MKLIMSKIGFSISIYSVLFYFISVLQSAKLFKNFKIKRESAISKSAILY